MDNPSKPEILHIHTKEAESNQAEKRKETERKQKENRKKTERKQKEIRKNTEKRERKEKEDKPGDNPIFEAASFGSPIQAQDAP